MVRMRRLYEIKTMWLLATIGVSICHILAADLPCAAREGYPGQGQICVCNSTYCDTVERPTKLPVGQYHRYTTSSSSPGFTHTYGSFDQNGAALGDADIVFTIDTTMRHQKIRGLGGSFTDSFGMVMDSLPRDAQDKLIESYFGPTGIEYTFCRTVIGSSDFSPRTYSYDDVPGDIHLRNFSLAYEDYKYKISYIKKAQAASERGIEVYGCSWNAPDWMRAVKSTGKSNSKSTDALTRYLSFEHYQTFADYHVKFLQAYKNNGVDIWAISEGNEPLLAMFMGVNMNLTSNMAHQQRFWVKNNLSPSLAAANMSNVKFLALDDMRSYATYWMERFADDPEAYENVDGIALHWYEDYSVPPILLDHFHRKFPDKKIYYTESSINPAFVPGPKAVQLGSWFRGTLYMYNIMENLNHWASGYIDWNLALNTEGGPSLSMSLDAAVIVNETAGEFYKQPMFYGMGHFSKFIPPGSWRVDVKSNQNGTLESNINQEQSTDFIKQQFEPPRPGPGPGPGPSPSIVVPSEVVCLATVNTDNSCTAIVLNNKNVTERVRLDILKLGSITVDLEENSITSFKFWIKD